MWRSRWLPWLASLLLSLTACQSAGLAVTDAYLVSVEAHSGTNHSQHSGSVSNTPAAAYFVVQNNAAQADRLLRVSTAIAQTAELHATTIENNVARMGLAPAIEVPANGSIEFKPGGYHVMLLNLTRPLTVGEKVTLTLSFEKAGEIAVQAEVRRP